MKKYSGSARWSLAVTAGLLLACSPSTARAQVPNAAGADSVAARWLGGVEIGRVPALRVSWEADQAGWIYGVGGGLGPGRRGVEARLTPTVRLGRRLAWGLRVDAALGFELVRLEGAGNAGETEIQWEITGGWQPRPDLIVEAGMRRTDYRNGTWEPVARLSAAAAARSPHDGVAPAPLEPGHRFGVPRAVTEQGRVALVVAAPRHTGTGALLAASNPEGDPDPWNASTSPNVDRLGIRSEAWADTGPVSAWARWSSDLHTDVSIAPRLRRVADGSGFPVSVSFSGGVRWSSPRHGSGLAVGVRHDPRAFLWMPHLGEERTARVHAVEAEAHTRILAFLVRHGALETMGGMTVEPLEHTDVRARTRGRWRIGIEHERVTRTRPEGSDTESATRAALERQGVVFGRLALGDDLVLRIGARTGGSPEEPADPGPLSEEPDARPDGFRGQATFELRTAPDLLDYESLLGRGWMARPVTGARTAERLARATVEVGWASFGLEADAGWRLPIMIGEALRREAGGRVDATWTGGLGALPGRGDLRIRLGAWGSTSSWWREQPILEGRVRLPLLEGLGRVGTEVYGRTALHSTRTGISEAGGIETTLTLAGPLPAWIFGLSGQGQLRLEDVLDHGLATRVGAPTRGRRLTILLLLGS